MTENIDQHVLKTYFTLRIGIAVISLAFPVILALGGYFYAGLELQASMSAYYHALNDGKGMRDWFVGILFAVGVFMYLYRGYSVRENLLLNAAGVLALCIALFPTEWQCGDHCRPVSMHGTSAIGFFACIAFVCVKCSEDTLHLLSDAALQQRFRQLYRLEAFLMLGSPLIAFILNLLLKQPGSLVFYVEAVGIAAFSAYWLTKSRELTLSQADVRLLGRSPSN